MHFAPARAFCIHRCLCAWIFSELDLHTRRNKQLAWLETNCRSHYSRLCPSSNLCIYSFFFQWHFRLSSSPACNASLFATTSIAKRSHAPWRDGGFGMKFEFKTDQVVWWDFVCFVFMDAGARAIDGAGASLASAPSKPKQRPIASEKRAVLPSRAFENS